MLKKLTRWIKKSTVESAATPPQAQTIAREDHRISRDHISDAALKVLYRLKKAGFGAYLVGGSVRDLMVGMQPKDFDVATDARPEQVRRLFRNSRIIGRRFRIVHVMFNQEIIEVITFRGGPLKSAKVVSHGLEHAQDNVYGTIEEDALRRDFTINALYYNIENFGIEDFVGGVHDIDNKIIRMIGDPRQRLTEDPARLIRAMRFSAKLNFSIEKPIEKLMDELAPLLKEVAPARLLEEVLKLFMTGYAKRSWKVLLDHHYVKFLFFPTAKALESPKAGQRHRFIEVALQETDERLAEGRTVNPAFVLSILLWPGFQEYYYWCKKRSKSHQAIHHTIDEVFENELPVLSITKRMLTMIRSVWVLQFQLGRRNGKRAYRLMKHRYFRAGVDFLRLRGSAGDKAAAELARWWDMFMDASKNKREQMLSQLNPNKPH